MLVVSELLGVARGQLAAQRLGLRSPDRFGTVSERVPVIVWNICRHCNMICPHCYASAGAGPSSGDLTPAEALGLLDQLAQAGVRVIIFSGGEPLLRDDLFTLLTRAKEHGISSCLSTNGVFIDADVAQKLRAAGVAYVGVSVDGLAEFNDAYRGLEGGFERAVAGLAHAQAAGMRTGLRVTVTRRNRDQVPHLLKLCCDRSIDRFYLSHLVYAGRGRRMAGEDLSPGQCRTMLEWLFEQADGYLSGDEPTPQIVTGGNDSDGVLLWMWVRNAYGDAAAARVRKLLADRGGNSAGEGILNVDNRGCVHPDQFWSEAVLGDLRTQSFADVLAHPLRAELARRGDRLSGRCGACEHRDLCRGSHRERALAASGDMWGSDPACVMLDEEIGAVRSPVSNEPRELGPCV